MSIYLTKNVQFTTRVEAFEKRGLGGQVAVKASESGVFPFSRGPIANKIRFDHLSEELSARLERGATFYSSDAVNKSILHRFDTDFTFEAPTLFVEMKAGGEVLNSYGMFEAATAKMGCYAGKPTSENARNIAALGLDLYLTVPAGNTNLAGYLAYIQAWRGISAFFAMGGGSGTESLEVYVGEAAGKQLAGREPTPAVTGQDGSLMREGNPGRKAGGVLSISDGSFMTGSAIQTRSIRMINPSTEMETRGLIFPFFPEMLENDPDTPFNIFWSLFQNCVSESAEELSEKATVYRRGFRFDNQSLIC